MLAKKSQLAKSGPDMLPLRPNFNVDKSGTGECKWTIKIKACSRKMPSMSVPDIEIGCGGDQGDSMPPKISDRL